MALTHPPEAVHVQPVFVVPVMEVQNCAVAFVLMLAVVGEIVMPTCCTACTVIVAVACFVVSAWLVAMTEYVPAVLGAV